MMNKPLIHYVKKLPGYTILRLWQWLAPILPDKIYLKVLYRLRMGYWMDFSNPKTFNEKIQWLKLYNRRPEYTTMVDKYAVKEYVADIIGKEHIIPTIGVWDNPEQIDWNALPQKFVLKTTHGGGSCGVFICKDKTTLNKEEAKQKLQKSLDTDIYYVLREWPYKDVKPRVIAEQYMVDMPEKKDLLDYKWYCFNGEPKYCQVIKDRTSGETIDFYDTNWVHQKFIGLSPVNGPFFENSKDEIECPSTLDEQICIARMLSKGMLFSRIDLYEIKKKTYFGEITFFPASGFGTFKPDCYNEILGKMMNLRNLEMIRNN